MAQGGDLKTGILIEAQTKGLDKLTALKKELGDLGKGAGDATPELTGLGKAIDALAKQQGLVNRFTELKRETSELATKMQAAQVAVDAAARAMREREAALKAATAAEREAAAAVDAARTKHKELQAAVTGAAAELQKLRQQARESGTATGAYATEIAAARTRLTELRAASAAAGGAVKALAADYRPVATALKEAGAASTAAERNFAATRVEAGRTKAAFEGARLELHLARQAMQAAGVSATNLAGEQVRLRTAADATAQSARTQAAAQRAAAEAATHAAALIAEAARVQGEAQRVAAEKAERLAEVGRLVGQSLSNAFSVVGVRSARDIQAEIQRVEQALQRLSADSRVSGADFDRAWAAGRARIAELSREMAGASSRTQALRAGVESISTQLARVQRLWVAWQSVMAVTAGLAGLARTADLFKNLEGRIALVNAGQGKYNVTLAETANLAVRTSSGLESTTQLMASIARAGEEIGVSQQDVLRLTESINKANQVAGQSAGSADAAVVQLIQGLQSGVLRGEEFNSMMEQSPRLARALADGLGVTVGELRRMAGEGRLTSETVIKALQSQAAAIDAEYAKLPLTIGRALTNLSTRWTQFLGGLDKTSGVTSAVAAVINMLANNLDDLANVLRIVLELVVVGFGAKAVNALRVYATATVAAGAATSTFAALVAAANVALRSFLPVFVIVGLVELAMAIYKVATRWDELREEMRVYREEAKKQAEAEDSIADNAERMRVKLEAISLATGVTVTSFKELQQAERDGKIHFDELTHSWQAGPGALAGVAAASAETAKQIKAVESALGEGVTAWAPVAEAAKAALTEVETKLAATRSAVSNALSGLGTAYQGLTAMVEQQLGQQVAAVQARFAAEKAALDNSHASQRTQIIEGTALLANALTEETRLRVAATAEAVRLVGEQGEAKKRAAMAEATTDAQRVQAELRAENEILTNKRAVLTQALTEYRRHVDALNAEANRHLGEVTRIENEKRALAMTTAQRIREIQRQGMSDVAAIEDRKREIAELQAKVREAIAAGEFDKAKELGQRAIDLAAQVASAQASEAKRAEGERTAAAQKAAEAERLYAQARAAEERGEIAEAARLRSEATKLALEAAAAQRKADSEARAGKKDVNDAVKDILASEKLLQEALTAEAAAHKAAAGEANAAGSQIEKSIGDIQTKVDDLSSKLESGLKVALEVDSSALDTALGDLQTTLAEREFLVGINADFAEAEKQLKTYAELLAAGKELPVDANFDKANEALTKFSDYARGKGSVELDVKIEKAQAAIGNVQDQIAALNALKTESKHRVKTNVSEAASEIDSLNGRNTSSTHTIYIQRVETNAQGGLAGSHGGVQHFARGGRVFPSMRRGRVPGTGNRDTVPRTLEAGAFVLRKAAVRYYGESGLQALIDGVRSRIGPAPSGPTGRVPAMLMPGERVFDRGTVARLGVGFFEGLNRMVIPPAMEPLVPHFAEGGSTNGMVFTGWFDAIFDRAEKIGGLKLRRQVEADARMMAKRNENKGLTSSVMDAVWAWINRWNATLDRMQISKEESDAKGSSDASAESSRSPGRGSMSVGGANYSAPGAGASAPGQARGVPDRVVQVNLKVDRGEPIPFFAAPGDADRLLTALEIARGSAG